MNLNAYNIIQLYVETCAAVTTPIYLAEQLPTIIITLKFFQL